MDKYLDNIYKKLEEKYYYQTEYLNTVKQFLLSINDSLNDFNYIKKLNIIERFVTPDRIITFKVPWTDDKGVTHVNLGYRVQHSNLLGVYKGGIRFHPSVNESILKFLALEQTLKNSLTDLPLGGAKGGSDFNPKGKSDNEIMRFCQNFIRELHKHIGPEIDVPAGDLGVGAKEVGYMFGMYKKLTSKHNYVFTSKGLSYGGSLLRPESTGYGICYITEKALDTYFNTSLKDKRVIISGAGQVGINVAYKAIELGAKVIAISNTSGVIYDETSIDLELIDTIDSNGVDLKEYLETYPNTEFIPDTKAIWGIKADIAIPSATQNELDLDDAKRLVKNGVKLVVEGANKPSDNDAVDYFIDNNVLVIPSKAANAGGVIVSSLEMEQNASTSKWPSELVDEKLKENMYNIFDNIYNTSLSVNDEYNLVKATNIAAFKKLYDAMKAQGV